MTEPKTYAAEPDAKEEETKETVKGPEMPIRKKSDWDHGYDYGKKVQKAQMIERSQFKKLDHSIFESWDLARFFVEKPHIKNSIPSFVHSHDFYILAGKMQECVNLLRKIKQENHRVLNEDIK